LAAGSLKASIPTEPSLVKIDHIQLEFGAPDRRNLGLVVNRRGSVFMPSAILKQRINSAAEGNGSYSPSPMA
jgi:hypothetical protein